MQQNNYRPPRPGPPRFGGGGGFRPGNMGFRPRADGGHFRGGFRGGPRGPFRGGPRHFGPPGPAFSSPNIGPQARPPPPPTEPQPDPYACIPDGPLVIEGLPTPQPRGDEGSTPQRRRDDEERRKRRAERSRSRSRSPGRRRSRSPSRRRRSRSRSPRRRRSRSREPRRDSPADFPVQPQASVSLRRIPIDATEEKVRGALEREGFFAREVRIGQDPRTGAARGSGRVEFGSVEEAVRWMNHSQGRLRLGNGDAMDCEFARRDGRSPTPPRDLAPAFNDWLCAKCGVNNFKRRDQCFQCGLRKSESDALAEEGLTEVGLVPSDTLLLRQLPRRCREEEVREGLAKVTTNAPLKLHFAPSDKFAYVQMANAAEATQLLNICTQLTRLEVGGKEVLVSYSKTSMANVLLAASLTGAPSGAWPRSNPQLAAQQALAAAGAGRGELPPPDAPTADATNAAAAVAQSAMNKATVIRQMAQQALLDQAKQQAVAQMRAVASMLPGGAQLLLQQQQQLSAAAAILNAARSSAAVSQASHLPPQPPAQPPTAQERAQQYGTVQTKYGELPKYPPPDTAQYRYDEGTGYYYDPTTGLYYDGNNTRLYYNSQTQKWLYWEGSLSTFLPVEEEEGRAQTEEEREKDKERKDREDKAEAAKKTAKDMEKWAKQMNKKGKTGGYAAAAVSFGGSQAGPSTSEAVSPGAGGGADLAFALLEKRGVSGLVNYEPDDDEEESSSRQQVPSEGISDWEKSACLLCQRKFPTAAALTKHNTVSSLHKKNLEQRGLLLPPQAPATSDSQPGKIQYRDRAKERRQKFGSDEPEASTSRGKGGFGPPLPVPMEASLVTEQPTRDGIKADNKGHSLLKSMGWEEGKGLGSQGQGITAPIESSLRPQRAGLGAARGRTAKEVSQYSDAYGQGYRQKLKDALRDRFHELHGQDQPDPPPQ